MRFLLLALIVAFAAPAEAKIYKWVLPDGSIKYSDQPQEAGAKPLQLPPLQTYTPPPLPKAPKAKKAAPGEVKYTEFAVQSPKDGQTLRDNGGKVSVVLALSPALAPGHTIDIMVDGKTVGAGRTTSIDLTNVDRGTHQIQAVVKDAKGKELARTKAVSFTLHRASRLF